MINAYRKNPKVQERLIHSFFPTLKNKKIDMNQHPSDTDKTITHSDAHTSRIVRLKEVIAQTGLSRSTIYHYISKGLFPSQIKLGTRAVGWRHHDIQNWIKK